MDLLDFRARLLAAIGIPTLAGCVLPCDESLERLDAPAEVDAGEALSCLPMPAEGCPEASTLSLSELAAPADQLCGYEGAIVAGPMTCDSDCCYEVRIDGEWCEGRPFAPTGTPRRARAGATRWGGSTKGGDNPELARAWRTAALDEHASIASFARLTLQLLALGAPPELVRAAARAQADEVRHARLAFAMAERFGGSGEVGGLDISGPIDTTPAAVLAETLRGGCVGETLAAALAERAAAEASTPALRRQLEALAQDELRHAALGWRIAHWLLATWPELRAELPVLGKPAGGPATAATPGQGRLDEATQSAVTAATWRVIVAPLVAALHAA